MSSRFGHIFDRLGSPVLRRYLADDRTIAFVAVADATPLTLLGCILGSESTSEEDNDDGRRQRLIRELTIPRMGNACFLATDPVEGQTFTIGTLEYYVRAVLRSTENTIDVQLYRSPSIEASQPGYRRR